MKNITFLSILALLLTLVGCTFQKESHGLPLPFSVDAIETVELIHHTGDPRNAQQKRITDSEDINYIHNMLSSDILIKSGSVDGATQTDTLYITFHLYAGNGYTIKFDSYGVKRGIISSKDSPAFTLFTPADICWIWGQLAKDYEEQSVSIADDSYATENPIATGYSS